MQQALHGTEILACMLNGMDATDSTGLTALLAAVGGIAMMSHSPEYSQRARSIAERAMQRFPRIFPGSNRNKVWQIPVNAVTDVKRIRRGGCLGMGASQACSCLSSDK